MYTVLYCIQYNIIIFYYATRMLALPANKQLHLGLLIPIRLVNWTKNWVITSTNCPPSLQMSRCTCVVLFGDVSFTDCMYVRKDSQIITHNTEICRPGTLHAKVSHRFAGT